MRIYDIGVGYGSVILLKSRAGRKAEIFLMGLDVLVTCGRPAPALYVEYLVLDVANMGTNNVLHNTSPSLFDQIL